MSSFDLSFDYRCPFAKNMHLHVITALRAGADFDVNFVPWSLSQGSRADGRPTSGTTRAYDADLLVARGGHLDARPTARVRFLDAHEALFRARHGGASDW